MGQLENATEERALAPDLVIAVGSTAPLGMITSSAGTGVQVADITTSTTANVPLNQQFNTPEVKAALLEFFKSHNEEAMKEHPEEADAFADEMFKLFDICKKVL